jgi:hypothetical protein
VRLPPAELAELDAWIAKQTSPMTRPGALRAMMALTLKVK